MAHNNPTSEARTACAPYNFIPLPERVVKAVASFEELPKHDRFDNADYPHSGYIEVELTTESPLYIRGPLNRSERRFDLEGKYRDGSSHINENNPEYRKLAKNKPDFFYIDPSTKEPVIPGSELRSMIETIFEIVTYSKFTRFDDRQIIYRDVAGSNSLAISYREKLLGENQTPGQGITLDYPQSTIKGGYLIKTKNGDWAIQPAICNDNTFGESFIHVECPPASPSRVRAVSVQPIARSCRRSSTDYNLELNIAYQSAYKVGHQHAAPYLPAWLIETWHVGGSKHMQCAVYEPDWSLHPIEIPDKLLSLYKEDCEIPRSGNTKTRDLLEEYGKSRNRDADNRVIVPLFYRLNADNTLNYFGSTMMFRLPYEHTTKDCVPNDLRMHSDIDYAMAVFGFVSNDHQQSESAYASRVRFTCGTLAENNEGWNLTNCELTPKILSGPKPTCFQHYLEQDRPNSSNTLVHYDDPDQIPLLRGTKRFWHQVRKWGEGNEAVHAIQNDNNEMGNKQKTLMLPLRGGVGSDGGHRGLKFTFRINFQNLSNEELGAILWAIEPSGRPAGNHAQPVFAHKIGMGKPYGMGSVSLHISKCILSNRKSRYSLLIGDDNVWHEPNFSLDANAMNEKKNQFEQSILTSLELGPDHRLAQVRRIAMLLKMMELPGQGNSPIDRAQGAANQIRSRSMRYMTIKISQNLPANQRNEYNNRPVLPDPLHWMSAVEIEYASLRPEPLPECYVDQSEMPETVGEADQSITVPTIVINHGSPEKPFPRFAVGDCIELTVSEEWQEKRGERKPKRVYTAADGAIGTFDGHVPMVKDGETTCIGRVTSIDLAKNRYKLKVVS